MGGTRTMRQAGDRYLPKESAETTLAYNSRLARSTLFGALRKTDLYEDDAHVLFCLQAARNALIDAKLDRIIHFTSERLIGFVPTVIPKTRWIDPPVRVDGKVKRLSEWNR